MLSRYVFCETVFLDFRWGSREVCEARHDNNELFKRINFLGRRMKVRARVVDG